MLRVGRKGSGTWYLGARVTPEVLRPGHEGFIVDGMDGRVQSTGVASIRKATLDELRGIDVTDGP